MGSESDYPYVVKGLKAGILRHYACCWTVEEQIAHQLPLLHEYEYSYGLPRMSGLRIFPGRPKAYLAQIVTPSLSYLNQLNGPKIRYNSLEKRWRTDQSGHEKSGHINAGPNEGIFFLDSMSPTQAPENPPQ